MKTISALRPLAAISAVALSFHALAADFPKTGQAEFDTSAVVRNLATIDGGAGQGGVDDYTGITRNVKGDAPFNDTSVRCLEQWTSINREFKVDGSCVLTDKDGDNILTTFRSGGFTLAGGTGKYKGITGGGPITVTRLHDAAGGLISLVGHHKVTWEIK